MQLRKILNRCARKSRQYVEKIISAERLFEVSYSYKHRYRDVVLRFPPWKQIRIDTEKDVNLVLFCGLGDALYGLPLFMELRKACDASGVNFNAWCAKTNGTTSNGAVATLLKETDLFNNTYSFSGFEAGYWKFFFWDKIYNDQENKETFYPFLYKTRSVLPNRAQAILNQYGIKSSLQPSDFPLPQTLQSIELTRTLKTHAERVNAKGIIFCHFDTRSGKYIYPYTDLIISELLSDGYVVMTPTDVNNIMVKSHYNFFKINPSAYPLLSLARTLEDLKAKMIAINSVFWAISEMIRAETLALHYLRSNDGHQFYHDKMWFLSPQSYCVKKVKNGLFIDSDMFTPVAYNPSLIHYDPDFLLSAIRVFLSDPPKNQESKNHNIIIPKDFFSSIRTDGQSQEWNHAQQKAS